MFLKTVALSLLTAGKVLTSAFDVNGLENSVHVSVHSKDSVQIPFYLQLLEAVAAIDDSVYSRAVYALVDDIDEDFEGTSQKDELVHQLVHGAAGLHQINQSLADLKAGSKYYTPRIEAQYNFYKQNVEENYKTHILKQCQTDSFGSPVDRKEGRGFAWLETKDRVYCTPDDLFALQLSKKSDLSALLQPFDRVLGTNTKAPLLVLYGDLEHEGFKSMYSNLYQSAESGKLRFVWRYVPLNNGAERLPNHAAALSIKRLQDPNELLTLKNFADLGLKFASKILTLKQSSKGKQKELLKSLSSLPNFVTDLTKETVNLKVAKSAKANEEMGVGDDIIGIYLNGAPVNLLELDTFKLINRIEEEVKIIQSVMDLGFSLDQARTLLTKFALNTAVKLSEFNHGGDDSRYSVYKHSFTPGSQIQRGGVVFINDIEDEKTYEDFVTSRDIYISSEYKNANKLPPLRENIHDLIFVVNLSSKDQLKVFFTITKMVLDGSIPQQIGVLPLVDSELDQKLAKYFYFLYDTTSSTEALAMLYKVYMRESDEEFEQLFGSIPIGNYKFSDKVYKKTIEAFSLKEPSVIFNGIIAKLDEEWRPQMARQIGEDVSRIQAGLTQGHVGLSVKQFLFQNAKSERNLEITPVDSSGFMFKKVTQPMISESTSFRYDHGIGLQDDLEIWIIGDLSLKSTFDTLLNVFELMGVSSFDIQLRVIDTSQSGILSKLQAGLLSDSKLQKNLKHLSSVKLMAAKENLAAKKFVSAQGVSPHHSFVLMNSRYFRLNKALGVKDLESIAEFEHSIRLSLVDNFLPKYPEIFGRNHLSEFYDSKIGLSFHDWKDLLISRLTKSFYVDDTLHLADVGRYDFSSLNIQNSFVLDNEGDPVVDVFVIIDPLLLSAQEIIGVIDGVVGLPFVRTRILLQPKQKYHTLPVTRFYNTAYASYPLQFDEEGVFVDVEDIHFQGLPQEEILSLDIITPRRWSIMPVASTKGFDIDNIKLSDHEEHQEIAYELSGILIEGFARDIKTANPPSGLTLKATRDHEIIDTTIMSNLGYFQLRAGFGTWQVSVQKKMAANFDMLSASSNPFDYHTEAQDHVNIDVFTLDGLIMSPRFVESSTEVETTSKRKDQINIFTVASGHLYEKLASIMITSIKAHTSSPVKLWILEDFLSPEFKQTLPELAKVKQFEYEFVSYKWPNWLRRQFSRQRTIWGYKILFLDVLFPVDVDEIIFVDADQISRSDMKELADIDMGDKAYGFVPMCDSRDEMKQFRFWEKGYWSTVLQDDLKYHISALYKVNLKLFREQAVGDRLRSHYQKLASDPNSLENLDQDLPNNMQRIVPIYSIPQEFLWCETWCGDDSLMAAKNVDLCNNPLTKEGKEDMGRRLIPEWTEYEKEVREVEQTVEFKEPKDIYKKEVKEVEDEDEDTIFEHIIDVIDGDFEHDEL